MISVLIATHDDERSLPRCLAALVPAAVEGLVLEVIVADAGSTDATLEIADDAGCRILAAKGDAAARLEAARSGAKGAWLLVLDADAWLGPGWEAAVRAHIERWPGRPAMFATGSWLGRRPRARLARKDGGGRGPARRLKPDLLPVAPSQRARG